MAAKIGILGETTVTTVGNSTVYTVPTSKAARIRVLFGAEAGASGWDYRVRIGSSDVAIQRVLAANEDLFTGIAGAGSQASNLIGIVEGVGTLDVSGPNQDQLILPYPHDYYLSTGDTVQVEIATTALLDHLFQVIGVEDDA